MCVGFPNSTLNVPDGLLPAPPSAATTLVLPENPRAEKRKSEARCATGFIPSPQSVIG
jgi:hypothetical protein